MVQETNVHPCTHARTHVVHVSVSLWCWPLTMNVQVVDAADVVLEILDARDPIGCRSALVERAVLAHPDKKLVLVLNKIDLVPKEVSST